MAEANIAVLRYDKRTTQPEVRQSDPRAITFLDFVRDAVAAGQRLQRREAVDSLVFVGHSQGGNVASAAATRLDAEVDVAALAAPALAVDSLFVAQLEASAAPTGCTASEARAQFDSLRAGRSVSNGLICGAGTTFWHQWIRHSQKADSVAAALEPPLFVQQGRADQNYPDSTLERNLTAWRRIARSGHATVETYEGVDHRFLNTGTTTTAAAPLNDLISWILDRS
jgi:alpha-beta hydrolase superfamily lysophospholipase